LNRPSLSCTIRRSSGSVSPVYSIVSPRTISKSNPDVVHAPVGNYSRLGVVPADTRSLCWRGSWGRAVTGYCPKPWLIVRSQGGSADDVTKLTFLLRRRTGRPHPYGPALRSMFGGDARR
jgi:hypothetical protein